VFSSLALNECHNSYIRRWLGTNISLIDLIASLRLRTQTLRRSVGSSQRSTYPALMRRSTRAVTEPELSPVAVANSPASTWPRIKMMSSTRRKVRGVQSEVTGHDLVTMVCAAISRISTSTRETHSWRGLGFVNCVALWFFGAL
jgi:hypothetical protein